MRNTPRRAFPILMLLVGVFTGESLFGFLGGVFCGWFYWVAARSIVAILERQ